MANSLFKELKDRNVIKVVTGYFLLGWLVLQIADVIVPALNLPEWTMTMLVVVGALGLPFVIFISWAFELTPDGIKREEEVRAEDSIKTATGQKLNLVVIGLLVLSLGYFIWESRFKQPDVLSETATVTDKSVAVLPFANFSSDEEQGWFADGLTEEILNSLARTKDILVSSRTSSFSYKDTTKDLRTIATELGVAHILEGSVRRSGDKVRVTAQLIRASDDFHLWSETYDRDYQDIILIQEDLAISIATALETAMDPEALNAMISAGTNSVEAYELFLKAQSFAMQPQDRIEILQKSLEIDPEFSRAQALLSLVWFGTLDISVMGDNDFLPPGDRLERAFEAVDRAISMAPDRAETLYLQAMKAKHKVQFRLAIDYYLQALELKPNDGRFLDALIELYIKTNQYDLAQRYIEEIRKYNPQDSNSFVGLIINNYWSGNYKDASKFSDEALAKFPDNPFLAYQAVRAYISNGDLDKAKRALDIVKNSDMAFISKRISQARYACAIGDNEQAKIYTQEALSDPTADLPNEWLLAHLVNDPEKAYRTLKPLDDDNRLLELSSMLYYHYFDVIRYPNLYAHLTEQGFDMDSVMSNRMACTSDSKE